MKSFLIALFSGLLIATADAALIATNLKCGYWQNPLGVDERGQSQTAYQILVASSIGALKKQGRPLGQR